LSKWTNFRSFADALTRSGIVFDLAQLKADIADLQAQMAEPGFWDQRERARNVSQELEAKKTNVRRHDELAEQLEELGVLAELAEEEDDDEAHQDVAARLEALAAQIDDFELATYLDGPYDTYPCYFMINAGAGGTDAQDWAEMLLRMYSGWLENHDYRFRVLEVSAGDVAGIKSATLEVESDYAFGYLKHEQGVHRLVRVSPYDADGRRHTSFCAVSAIPVVDNPDIEVNDEDLRIDTYRAGGAGGQHVNKTDTAVRITHVPSGVIVACQKERSQHQNKEIAMRLLKARLYELKRQEQEAEIEQLRDDRSIEWGSQIRSYVLHPYQLVKDHRTDVEIGNVDAVLNGEIDPFIEAVLRQQPAASS